MTNSLSQQINLLLQALNNTYGIINQQYGLAIKFVTYTLLSVLFYQVGKASVKDPIQSKIYILNKNIKQRLSNITYMPKKIKKLQKILKIILFMFVICSLVFCINFYYQKIQLNFYQLRLIYFIGGLFIFFLILVWIYKSILTNSIKNNKQNDESILNLTNIILNLLGKRAQILLKGTLCFQKLANHKQTIGCQKLKCKNHRAILKQKTQLISQMVENVIKFQWCSICKKRMPFDEFTNFKNNIFQNNETIKGQEQVINRNEYLVKQIERMIFWIQQIKPCNCSSRYWTQSLTQVKQFKQKDKSLSQKLINLEQNKNGN